MLKMIRSPLCLMALTIFIHFTGFGVILPLLPFWAQRFGAGPVGVGLVLTIYALAQRLFADKKHSLDDICSTLGISRSTLYRYVREAKKASDRPE